MTGVLIIAPHVDDELIGCYSVITNPDNRVSVVYLHELTMERLAEATQASSAFGFDAFPDSSVLTEEFIRGFDRVYVPSRRDWHIAHREANAKYRVLATHFYSVDMPQGIFLGNEISQAKHAALDRCYPSQSALWMANAKYYLFEQIEREDYDRYIKITGRDKYNLRSVGVRVLQEYEQAVEYLLDDFKVNRLWREDELYNTILQRCPKGRVTMTNQEGYVWESEQ